MSRICVTGGAGFLGSNLCEYLVSKNHDVVCVDNLYSSDKRNIYDLLDYKNFEFIRHDITFPLYLEVDQIYNLACPASPIHYQRDPVFTIKTNIHGSINVLGMAKRTKSRIFQASTSEIYGDPEVHPQTETYWGNVNPTGIRSCYDEGKRAAESLFFDYKRQHNLDIRVARIFNTYGPKMHDNDGRVVSNFITQALKNEPITIYGTGEQTRSFCYVYDLIKGIVSFMSSDDNELSPVNLGNPVENTIAEIATMIVDLTGSSSNIIYKELPDDDPKRRKPDISKAQIKLNWNPVVSLKEGLFKTISYFENKMR